MPDNATVLHDRGVAYRLKGDRERAIADFREAVRIAPLGSIQSLNELAALGVAAPKTEGDALKQGVLDLLK
jgi:Flp pilus assembly protein TadD